jgi:hypothetical protein
VTFERPNRDYNALLNPDVLRPSLIAVALFVLAYESFRERAIQHVRMLYWCGIDGSGHKYKEDDYRADILSRSRSPFHASLDWYREMGALDAIDLASVETLRKSRNRLVHQLMEIVGTNDLASELTGFAELARIYRKVEVWRVVNIELAGDPEWEGKEINEEEIMPGPILMMQMLTDVALGEKELAAKHYSEFVHALRETPEHLADDSK